jgi:hypothetical protein
VTEAITRRSLTRRTLFVNGGFIAFTLLFVIACRVAVLQPFRGIESSRSSGLSSVWNVGSMWADGSFSRAAQTETGKAGRQRDGLLSTVAQAHIRLTLLEDFRPALEPGFARASLGLRNSTVEGVCTILSSLEMAFGANLEYGLPIGL